MLVIPCKQGTEEWFQARLGKLTASAIADILPLKDGGLSAGRDTLIGKLLAERLWGRIQENYVSDAMRWGAEHEAEARDIYSRETGFEVVQVGFVQHPSLPEAGCSPDGLVDPEGLVEIKCPTTEVHKSYIEAGTVPDRYLPQMAWQLACTDRKWVDFWSYDPRHKQQAFFVTRMVRNEELISELNWRAKQFLGSMDRIMRGMGR